MQCYSDISDISEPICYIMGAGDFDPHKITLKSDDLLIAADGGFNHLRSVNITPSIIVGDFDSLDDAALNGITDNVEIIQYPVKKDETDTHLAAQVGHERGYKYFVIYGGTGGTRPSHTYANYALLADLALQGTQGFLMDAHSVATVIHCNTIVYAADQQGYLSVFAYGGSAIGVTIRGARYELNKATLEPAFPLGVSNQLVGGAATVSVQQGTLLIIYEQVR